ncbi:hypothetical protein HDU91_007366, partial [Kappamyces sp. JEL0680]
VTKPFDVRISNAMLLTTADLVDKFTACTGYTSSDEISLVFDAAVHTNEQPLSAIISYDTDEPPQKKAKQTNEKHLAKKKGTETLKTHPYNGRMQKLASVVAGYASARYSQRTQLIVPDSTTIC